MNNPPDREAREKLHGSSYVREFSNGSQKRRVERLLAHASLPPSAHILDIGCGIGLLAELLDGRYATYTGVDFSNEMVEAARHNNDNRSNRQFHCTDAASFLSSKADEYDAIFLLDISEHVPDDEWAKIVMLARPALTATGKVYLHTPNLEFFVELLKHHNWLRQFPEHIAVRSSHENRAFFERSGYSSVKVKSLPHYNVLRCLHPLSSLPIIGKHLTARLWIAAQK
ncbi:methyltransferase domain-containing protein [Stenotrophomonas sp.]|uniref:SAM-dependent methyltransferase n=1 Tax=Stenotrophomonas sp. TaxID=69392 RepID=UPI0028A6103A|nr:methyltransferase domain-containing protein [Stenotrophomonas sp.]